MKIRSGQQEAIVAIRRKCRGARTQESGGAKRWWRTANPGKDPEEESQIGKRIQGGKNAKIKNRVPLET